MLNFVELKGGLAQLARVLAWQARGHRFESDILHFKTLRYFQGLFLYQYQTKKVM